MTDTILVTGASGFIAQHIVKLLIANDYIVIGTVRLAAKGEKLANNVNVGSKNKFSYGIVPDISAKDSFHAILAENPQITVILHTALPFFYDTTDPEQDLIVPATEGTKNIMAAIHKNVELGNSKVRRVVVTSSDAALYSAEDEQNSQLSFDETSWNNISRDEAVKDPISAYYGAKSFAEKIAWQFSQKPRFPPLSIVNPVYVFGPQAFENEVSRRLNTSNEVINGLLHLGKKGKFENDMGGFIDVRDVAKAHLAAFTREDTIGKRLFMINGHFSIQMMLDVIHEKFPDLANDIPYGTPGSGPNDISTLAKTSNQATRDLLQFSFILLDQCVSDVVQQILDYRSKQRV